MRAVDLCDLEDLKSEIGDWRDNMDGSGLENTDKFQEVSDCADELDGIDSDVPSIESLDDIDDAIDQLQRIVDDLEGVSFPGMY